MHKSQCKILLRKELLVFLKRRTQNLCSSKILATFRSSWTTRKTFRMIKSIEAFLKFVYSKAKLKVYSRLMLCNRRKLMRNHKFSKVTDLKIQICHKNIKFRLKSKMIQAYKKARKRSPLWTFQAPSKPKSTPKLTQVRKAPAKKQHDTKWSKRRRQMKTLIQ